MNDICIRCGMPQDRPGFCHICETERELREQRLDLLGEYIAASKAALARARWFRAELVRFINPDQKRRPMTDVTEKALDSRARRAARRCGLHATKSRWRRNSIDNFGGFALVDERNCIVAGAHFDMSAEDVIDYCVQEG
jgi:hypothetical protein